MTRSAKFYLVGAGVAAAVVYLVISAIQATGVPYRQVHELRTLKASDTAREVKVTGKLKTGTLEYDPNVPRLTFVVRGPRENTIRVRYRGIKPDALQEEGHVILEGTYHPDRGLLDAHTLLAKCPSRYRSQYPSYSSSD